MRKKHNVYHVTSAGQTNKQIEVQDASKSLNKLNQHLGLSYKGNLISFSVLKIVIILITRNTSSRCL